MWALELIGFGTCLILPVTGLYFLSEWMATRVSEGYLEKRINEILSNRMYSLGMRVLELETQLAELEEKKCGKK